MELNDVLIGLTEIGLKAIAMGFIPFTVAVIESTILKA